MDNICAVCAEAVEWAAYGLCGHRDVCAVCIARLRFVCHDRRCCICKSLSPFVFITKALGSLTRIINDFSVLPAEAKDGKVGSYWFHEGIQAYFDDFKAYKIIQDMCKLSCTVCDKSDAHGKRKSKRRGKFKDVEQLKDHISRQHELFFCSLCLVNKKVFLSEQKLYSRVQLTQHIRYGDSEVDGSKSERCGFSGHPFCKFCQIPFYGDNELYFHMSTDHFTCHICKSENSVEFEYYKDYNDLEDHFREDHFLCEDNTCLDKKFIVFATAADMKRHAALEHGGNMSLSKCNVALLLPTSFHSREREEEDYRVRTHVCGPGVSSIQTSSAASLDAHGTVGHSGISDISSAANSEFLSGGLQGTSLDFRGVLLSGLDFPALPKSSKRRRRKSKMNSQESGSSSVVLLPAPSASPYSQSVRSSAAGLVSNPSSAPLHQSRPLGLDPSRAVLRLSGPLGVNRFASSSSVSSSSLPNSTSCGLSSRSSASSLYNSIKHVGSSSSVTDMAAGQSGELTAKEDLVAANKSLIEKILATLEYDKDKFAAFKIVLNEYRDDDIDAQEYLSYVHQFGLAHLVSDLARLCPDLQKQKALMEIHKSSLGDTNETSSRRDTDTGKSGGNTNKKKGKGKCKDSESSKGGTLPDGIVNHIKELKLSDEPCTEEHSSSNGVDHAAKVISESPAVAETYEKLHAENDHGCSLSGTSNCSLKITTAAGKKKLKKSSKFLKTRLESSTSMVANFSCPVIRSDLFVVRPTEDSILATVRGVWHNGGGRRLVNLSEAVPSSR